MNAGLASLWCGLGILLGAVATWALARAMVRARRLLLTEAHQAELDQVAVRHALALEAVRRGADVGAADENVWQLLQQMRAEERRTTATPDTKVLRLPNTRTVRAQQRG